jgi:SPP1 gp7 family putative phage head morphogenesis protein
MLEEEAKNTVKLEHAFWLLLFAFLSKDGEKIASADLNNIIRYGKYHGLTRRQIIDKVTSADISRIYETIASGLDRNHSLNQIKEDLSTAFKQTRRFIAAETETVINGVADDAALAFASANGKKLRYTAVLDLATCGECMDLDGNEYEDGSPDIPYLPRHIHCRCILVPIAGESMKAELDKANFKKYFENLPDSEKQKRLGKVLYEKYVSGELKADHYITPDRTARLKVDDIAKRDNSALA